MASRSLFASFAALPLLVSSIGCGTDDIAQGVVRGRVRTQDGSELEQVTVRAGTKSVKTDRDGNFTLHVKAGGERRVAVDSKEFAGGEALVSVKKNGEANLELGVMRASTLEIEDAEKGGQFEGEDGFSLKLPEKALRGAGGRSSKGGAEVRYAAIHDAKLMRVPPELRTSDEQGREQRLKSHGLVEVRFYSGDEQLEIAGQAEVEVPLPAGTALKDGERVDLYHYDTTKQRFEREGEAEIKGGKWVAKLDKFSWWTIAEPAGDTGCVAARLRTPENEPSAGVVASAVGIDELWLASAVTDAAGEVCLEAPAGSTVQLSAFWDDGEDSGEWSERADLPERAGMCGGEDCLELGSRLFSSTPDEEPDAGSPDAGGGTGSLFEGLNETKTSGSPGETVSFTFSALGGERLAYTLSSTGAVTADIRIIGPDGKTLTVGNSVVSADSSSFDDAFLLPAMAGVYTLEVVPRSSTGAGTFTLDLFGVPDDESAAITADGAPVSIDVSSVAQNAVLTLTAEGGERLAYSVDNSGDTPADLWLVGPSGNRLSLGNLAVSSGSHGFTDQFVLPAVAGEYLIQIDPRQQGTGSFELTLFSVPDDVVVDVAPDGAPASLTIPSLAQNGAFRLRAAGGERLAYTLENAGATTVDTALLDPAGVPVSGANGATSAGSTRFADSFVLPSTPGDYLLTVDPRGEAIAGSFTLVLMEVPPDATAPIAIGGAASSLSIPDIGQNGAFTFSATGGERLAYTVQNRADGTADLVIVDPNGQRLTGTNTAVSNNSRTFHDQFALPAVAGAYQLQVDPRAQATGAFDATLLRVPADAVAASPLQTYAGATSQPLTATTTGAGQNAALDISVTAPNAVVAYYVTNGATATLDVQLSNPGGTLVPGSNRGISAGTTAFVDAFALGAAGTYRLALDPRLEGTGQFSVRFFQVAPPRPTAPVTAGAGPTRITMTIPGQIAVFSFALNAGQSFSYSVARVGSSVADTRLFDPMQRNITPSGGAVVSSATPLSVSSVTAATAGTYTLEVDARNDVIDSYDVTLTTP